MRLDKFLKEQGLINSREKATKAIKEGLIAVNQKIITKPSHIINLEDKVKIQGEISHYVARSAYKLLHALNHWKINPKNKICLDIGASTGGFSQVLLEQEAKKIYAIDVGTNQLADQIKSNPKVISIEKTNARHLQKSMFTEPIEFICIDVSFISLELILPTINKIINHGEIIALIKPQFEAGRNALNKNGIIKNPEIHNQVCQKIETFSKKIGIKSLGIIPSPIEGGDGNKEFLIYLKK